MYVLVRSSKKMLSHVSQCLWFIKKEGKKKECKGHSTSRVLKRTLERSQQLFHSVIPSRPAHNFEIRRRRRRGKKEERKKKKKEKRTRLQCCRMQCSQENEARQNLHRHRRHLATALDLHAAARLLRQLSASCFCSFHERPKTPRCLHATMLYCVRYSLTELIRESVLVSSKVYSVLIYICIRVCIDT